MSSGFNYINNSLLEQFQKWTCKIFQNVDILISPIPLPHVCSGLHFADTPPPPWCRHPLWMAPLCTTKEIIIYIIFSQDNFFFNSNPALLHYCIIVFDTNWITNLLNALKVNLWSASRLYKIFWNIFWNIFFACFCSCLLILPWTTIQ